ncbi:MAG TPA: hypothetical protein VFH64_05820 [Amnibacterium sp.]|nr:hypothetical protein [Amnibacterium sp.]
MIYALRQPAILLGLVAGFLIGIPLRAAVQRLVTRPGGLRRGRLAVVGGRRTRLGWPGYLDPYGAVAALISGAGWGPRIEARRTALTDTLMLVSALLVHGAMTALGLAGFIAAGGGLSQLHGLDVSTVLHGTVDAGQVGRNVGLGFAMVNLACGILALVPIPPLELGVILWSRLPRSPQARRIAFHVLEEHWGVAVLLVLLLLPLAGQPPALLAAINAIGGSILDAL